jgi:hypothetical protein
MRMISIDGNYKLPTDWKEEVSSLDMRYLTVVTVESIIFGVNAV